MAEFQSMFMKSKGQPIEYEGNMLVMADYFPTQGATKFRLTMETCNGVPVREDTASSWSTERGTEHRNAQGFFRTSEDGLAPWRNLEASGKWRQAASLRLVFKTRQGKWQQGAGENSEGHFLINGQTVSGKSGVILWQSNAWDTIEFEVSTDATFIEVHNSWDCGNGVVQAWHNGAAMIVESLPNGRRYRCNDGFADDDFNDIVFRLERVESA